MTMSSPQGAPLVQESVLLGFQPPHHPPCTREVSTTCLLGCPAVHSLQGEAQGTEFSGVRNWSRVSGGDRENARLPPTWWVLH